jgi:hypothetical protein
VTSFEDRRDLSYALCLRPDADVREVIAWCRDNIQPRRDIVVSACLWSAASRSNCKVTSRCWCSILPWDNAELEEYMTFESLKLYNGRRNASFAFHTREDSLLFDLRWR